MKDYRFCPFCKGSFVEKHLEGHARNVCRKCGWIAYKNPLPAVSCLVSNPKNELLLIKRGIEPYKGAWCIPGGFVEMNETLREAAQRELVEETGVSGKAGRFVGAYIQKSRMYGAVMIVGIELTAKSSRVKAGDDAEDARFFPFKHLPEIPLESHRNLIKDYLHLKRKA